MAASDIKARIGADFSEFQKQARKMERRLGKTIRKMERAGNSLSRSLTAPVVALGAISTRVFTNFEQSMLKVKAIGNVTGKSFVMLESQAKKLGETTMFSASQVAALQLNLTKLGFTPTQINASTEAILRLAQATDSDLAESATVAASTLRGFGLEVEKMGMVADVMADAFSSSALDMEKFKVSMAVVAPVAQQAGATIQETSAILGTLVNRGVDASSAGSALRNIFLDLAKEGLTFSQAMNMINNSTNPLADSMELFGKRGATVATIIANNRTEINGLTKDLQDSAGEAAKAAAIMDSGLGGVFRRLRSQLEAVAIQFGEDLKPAIISVTTVISKLLKGWMKLSDTTRQNIVKFGLLAAAIGPVILGFSKLLRVVKMLIGFFGKGALFNPWVLAATAIAAVAVHIYNNWDRVKKQIVRIVNYFIDLYNESIVVRTIVSSIVSHFKNMFEIIKAVVLTVINLGSAFKNLADAFLSGKFNFADVIKKAFDEQTDIGTQMGENILDNIEKALDNITFKANIEHIDEGDLQGIVDNLTAGIGMLSGGGGGGSTSSSPTQTSSSPTQTLSGTTFEGSTDEIETKIIKLKNPISLKLDLGQPTASLEKFGEDWEEKLGKIAG